MNILISACLCGDKVRYDGKDNFLEDFFEKDLGINFIKVCPEVEGGLSVPRNPCEIKNNKVIDKNKKDLTIFFEQGAKIALKKCLDNDIKVALLKAKSPSCGNDFIYDGSFSRKLVAGQGISVRLLRKNNIKVFNEKQINEFLQYINKSIERY